jgi:ribonuclease D
MRAQNLSIEWIDTPAALHQAVLKFAKKENIAFDTEFDSFNRSYGFTLLLIQVCDGQTVYLIDPLRISDLRPLWNVFEDASVQKIGYALGEDIRLLKTLQCAPKNLFDIQIARSLSNRPEGGLAKSLAEELGVELDKSAQTSDWSKRPLSADQERYLANDVVHLNALKDIYSVFTHDALLNAVFEEEMKALEEVEVTERIVQLTKAQARQYDPACRKALLDLMLVRDRIAQKLNVPHNYVVQTDLLEWIVENKSRFLENPFVKGFHRRVRGQEEFRNQFLEVVREAPDSCAHVARERGITGTGPTMSREERLEREAQITREMFLPVEQSLLAQYEEDTVKFLLRGVRRAMISQDYSPDILKPYQRRFLIK